jgi:hypothetical protein
MGADVQELALQHDLSPVTVQQIVLSERHKTQVSDDPFYRTTRAALGRDDRHASKP